VLRDGDFDVVHFHNVSLIGGPAILALDGANGAQSRARRAHAPVKLMTAHEHWLVCPLSLLWKRDREPCTQPQCVRCSLAARKPVQLWRYTGLRERALSRLDALVTPSFHTAHVHRERGITARIEVLPHFLPDDWAQPSASAAGGLPGGAPEPVTPAATPAPHARPYFAAAGRLVNEKGYQDVIRCMPSFPDIDLRIAGAGPYEPVLRRLAAGMPNVRFLGFLDFPDLARLFRDARALIAPSLFYETFGLSVLEAMSLGTPVLARRRGALPELVEESGGGLTFESQAELATAMRSLLGDDALRARLGERASAAVANRWSEAAHIDRYLALIDSLRRR
jgi:glycosyltransferase involved in cell wall biosynthesis